MIYFLDTDIIILLMRGLKTRVPRSESQRKRCEQTRHILANCRSHAVSGYQIACSAVTLAELEYGARHSDDYEREMRFTRIILAGVEVLDFSAPECAEAYGKIRESLESQGRVIGENDLLIAAHAQALQAVMVTNNVREFSRLPDLSVENWTTAS